MKDVIKRMTGKPNSTLKQDQDRKESRDQPGQLTESGSFLQLSRSYNNRPRLELGGLGEVIQSIRREEYASNMDIPTELFYKVTGCKEGNPLPIALSPVTHLNPTRSRTYLESTNKQSKSSVDEVSTTAVLPSIGRPYSHLGVEEVEEDTSSSSDAAIFDDPDDTEGESEAEALELGICTKDLKGSSNWTYDCIVDDDGVNVQSLVEGFNMFLLQAQMNKDIKLEKVSLQGNRIFGFISPVEDGSTLWGSARSSATITELPKTPRQSLSQPSCSASVNLYDRPRLAPTNEFLFARAPLTPAPVIPERQYVQLDKNTA